MCRHQTTGESYLETALSGAALLAHPILNKGSGFTEQERHDFGLDGLLPATVSALELQLERIYGNYQRQTTNIGRYINLLSLQDRNETAYYALLGQHLTEMMPIIYTPVVGEACQTYSRIYHRPRGLYVSYPQRDHIDALLANFERRHSSLVVTEGRTHFGIGTGRRRHGHPHCKLALTPRAQAFIVGNVTIVLDVGTNILVIERSAVLGLAQ